MCSMKFNNVYLNHKHIKCVEYYKTLNINHISQHIQPRNKIKKVEYLIVIYAQSEMSVYFAVIFKPQLSHLVET